MNEYLKELWLRLRQASTWGVIIPLLVNVILPALTALTEKQLMAVNGILTILVLVFFGVASVVVVRARQRQRKFLEFIKEPHLKNN